MSFLLKLLVNKDAFYIGLIVIGLGAAWYVLDDWHYKPLRVQEETVKMLSEQYNQCVGVRDTCEARLLSQSVEDYQNGLGEANDTININLDNLNSN